MAPRPLLPDRDEEEVGGYRYVLTPIHKDAADLPVGNETICFTLYFTNGLIWAKFKRRPLVVGTDRGDARGDCRRDPADGPTAFRGVV
jgi:hypothetical protein